MATRLSGNRFAALASDTFLGDGFHLADEFVVGFAFYNVGINNDEVLSTKWLKGGLSSKRVKLKVDIEATFTGPFAIHALFISEFGQMYPNIDEFVAGMTRDMFEDLLREIDLTHLVIIALPPYVAIVDSRYWEVLDCIKCGNLCTEERDFAMKVFFAAQGIERESWCRKLSHS